MLWIYHFQGNITLSALVGCWSSVSIRRIKRLGADVNNKGIVVVGSRMAEWLKSTWNRSEFELLPSGSNFAKLHMLTLHNKGHCGVDAALAKLRSKFWIPGACRILKAIRNRCVVCRKRQKNVHGQKMGLKFFMCHFDNTAVAVSGKAGCP